MAIHMSLRLAWHDNGWNGHICQKPRENSYCVGQYSYPGDLIAGSRDLDFETAHCGEACKNFPCRVACGFSVNAFGEDSIKVKAEPPGFWLDNYALSTEIELPPRTACTWCYEKMYSDDIKVRGDSARQYDYDKRREAAKNYFAQFEPGKSLILYYAGYSNPFSENEENNYVVVGISRLKKISPLLFYDDASTEAKQRYGGAFIWQMPVTGSSDEGFCIPYHKYMNDEDALNKIVVKPSNRAPFKYGSREVSNDDAIEIINQLLASIDALIALGDTTENWNERRNWLNSLLVEIWQARGPYPGFPAVLEFLGLQTLISGYIKLTDYGAMKNYVAQVRAFLSGTDNDIAAKFSTSERRKIPRNCQLLGKDKLKFLFDVLARFALTAAQIKAIIDDNRANVSVTATIAEMTENPYVIFEQYTGYDPDDIIPFYKIDNGVIPSPKYGIDNLLDVDSAERLRALCVDE